MLLVACGEAPPDSSGGGRKETKGASADDHSAPPESEPPPSVIVLYFDESIELAPWTYCFGSVCADGMPPENPPDVGSPEEIIVEYPLPGWSFTASFRPSDDDCGRVQEVPLEPAGGGTFVLRPAGYAGTYDVTLFGRGNGDLFATFRWTTITDGFRPKPEARLAVLADHDGKVDSYGIELQVTHLARTPRRASALVTVRADEGGEVTFKAERPARDCWPPEGTLYWDGPDKKGLAAAALGERSFTYEVELMLDGVRYVATARWPADEIAGNEPSVALNFTPNLPALP
jgi:hypothetical protein